MIDAFEFRQFIGDIQVEDAVDATRCTLGQRARFVLLLVDDIAKGEVVVGAIVGRDLFVALAASG